MCLGMAIRRVKVLREKVQKFAGIVDILFEQDKKKYSTKFRNGPSD